MGSSALGRATIRKGDQLSLGGAIHSSDAGEAEQRTLVAGLTSADSTPRVPLGGLELSLEPDCQNLRDILLSKHHRTKGTYSYLV